MHFLRLRLGVVARSTPGEGTRHPLQESGSEIRRLGRSATGALRGASGVSKALRRPDFSYELSAWLATKTGMTREVFSWYSAYGG